MQLCFSVFVSSTVFVIMSYKIKGRIVLNDKHGINLQSQQLQIIEKLPRILFSFI